MLIFLNLLIKRRRSENDDNENINPAATKQPKIEDSSIVHKDYFNFEYLPNEIQLNILKYMDLRSLKNLSLTNHANLRLITQGEVNHSAVTYDFPIFGEPLIWTQIREKYIAPSLFYGKAQMQWDEVQLAIVKKILSPLEIQLSQPAKTYKEFYEIEEILNLVNINFVKLTMQNQLKYDENKDSLNLELSLLTRFPLKQMLKDPALSEKLLKLKILDLSYNSLYGSIPNELGQLKKLKNLKLGFNQLTGPIPIELGQLNQLEHIDISDNFLIGPPPVELAQRFTSLSNLDGNIASQRKSDNREVVSRISARLSF